MAVCARSSPSPWWVPAAGPGPVHGAELSTGPYRSALLPVAGTLRRGTPPSGSGTA